MAGEKKTILVLYWLLNCLGIIISLIGAASGKIIAVLVTGVFIFYNGKATLVKIASIVLFWLIYAFVFSSLGRFLVKQGLMLSNFSRRFNISYIERYGKNFKHPEFDDYDLEKEEFYSYNRRFTIDTEVIPLFFMLFILIFLLNIAENKSFVEIFMYFIFSAIASIVVKCIILSINNRLSKKFPQHEKVKAYVKARDIYKKIQEEIQEDKDAFLLWGK